ncbi:MAG: hypothetical protein AAF297_04170 [Planctomycetota bacterium]
MPARTTPLPKVLVTDVIRSAHKGDAHGGVRLVDLASGDSTKVLDWNDDTIDWEGRGGDRGLRGIAFYNDHIVIAASNEVFVFDQSFKVIASYANPYLSHAHEIALEGDHLYVTSTKFNSILVLDLAKGTFINSYQVRDAQVQRKDKRGRTVAVRTLVAVPFDPNTKAPVPPRDVHHINSIHADASTVTIGGVRMNFVAQLPLADRPAELKPLCPTPPWTHNARPFLQGFLYNATEDHAVVFADKAGKPRWRAPIPTPAADTLEYAKLPNDHARSGFGRGLATTDTGLVIIGSAPSTITAYKLMADDIAAQVQLTKDVRNTPHGLEVWPYG